MRKLSEISFVTFCVEKYAEYKNIKSNEAYRIFENNGVIDMLVEDYEDLHGQGFEYLVNFIDKFLRGATQ